MEVNGTTFYEINSPYENCSQWDLCIKHSNQDTDALIWTDYYLDYMSDLREFVACSSFSSTSGPELLNMSCSRTAFIHRETLVWLNLKFKYDKFKHG